MIPRIVCFLILVLPMGVANQDPPSGAPSTSPWVYEEREIEGWTVFVETALLEKEKLAERLLAKLQIDLWEIRTRLPLSVVEKLQDVPFWFHLRRTAAPGGVYHPSADWLENHDLPAKWARGIEFGVAANFLGWSREQPSMVLHELSHAWHLQLYSTNQSMNTTEGFDQGVTDLQMLVTVVALGDVDGNGVVNTADILAVIGAWGICDACDEDVNGDGFVGVGDLLQVIEDWG